MREKEDHDCPLFFFYHQSLIASGDAGGRGWHLVVAAISLNSLAAIYKEIWRTDRPHTVRTVNNKNMLRFERDKKKKGLGLGLLNRWESLRSGLSYSDMSLLSGCSLVCASSVSCPLPPQAWRWPWLALGDPETSKINRTGH